MRELDAIVECWTAAETRRATSILATVVDVKGSAYRRPGARMLMTSDGHRVGSISGGCLEGDVVKKAWWWTESGAPVVRTYDTTSEDEAIWEFGLGCNGVVRVLLERIEEAGSAALKPFLEACGEASHPGVTATVITSALAAHIGERLLLYPDGTLSGALWDKALQETLDQEMRTAQGSRQSRIARYDADGGPAEVFLEVIAPPLPLLLFGAGHDALPIVRIAKELGWRVTVLDGRPAYASKERFPLADQVVLTTTADPLGGIAIDPHAAAVVMNHNYPQDRAVLQHLVARQPRYIGMLGPKARTDRMLGDLKISAWPASLHAPIGLDIGGESPESIALSILAEIQSAYAGRSGGNLRDRSGPIYSRAADGRTLPQTAGA